MKDKVVVAVKADALPSGGAIGILPGGVVAGIEGELAGLDLLWGDSKFPGKVRPKVSVVDEAGVVAR